MTRRCPAIGASKCVGTFRSAGMTGSMSTPTRILPSFTAGRAPGGWTEHRQSGDPNDSGKAGLGGVTFPAENVSVPAYWIVHEACDPDPGVAPWTWAEKTCNADKFPDLHIDIAPRPKQSFACLDRRSDTDLLGIIMQVGECAGSQYGLYLYTWSDGCGALN
jgi:hypothetical protein